MTGPCAGLILVCPAHVHAGIQKGLRMATSHVLLDPGTCVGAFGTISCNFLP